MLHPLIFALSFPFSPISSRTFTWSTVVMLSSWPGVPEEKVVARVDEHWGRGDLSNSLLAIFLRKPAQDTRA